jgi:hypothetical protein
MGRCSFTYVFLGGADKGNKTLTLPKEEVLAAMERSRRVRGYMAKAGV